MSEQNVKETQVSEAVVAETAETSNQREERRNNRGERRGRGERRNNRAREEEKDKYIERVVTINRVSKVVGDGNGLVGVGYGKAKEVPAAISKGVEEAKKNFFRVPRIEGRTIPHRVQGEAAAGVVMLRPATAGTGVIAGGPVRAVLECAGIHDVLSKSLGSSNQINIVHATVAALKELEEPLAVAARRGLPTDEVIPSYLRNTKSEKAGA